LIQKGIKDYPKKVIQVDPKMEYSVIPRENTVIQKWNTGCFTKGIQGDPKKEYKIIQKR